MLARCGRARMPGHPQPRPLRDCWAHRQPVNWRPHGVAPRARGRGARRTGFNFTVADCARSPHRFPSVTVGPRGRRWSGIAWGAGPCMGAPGAVNGRNKFDLPGGGATVGRGPRTGTPLAQRPGARHATPDRAVPWQWALPAACTTAGRRTWSTGTACGSDGAAMAGAAAGLDRELPSTRVYESMSHFRDTAALPEK